MTNNLSEYRIKCDEIEKEIWDTYIDENGKSEPIVDGIVNIEKYLTSKLKILWVLKEPYDDEEDGFPSGGGWHFGNDFLAPDGFYKRMGRSRTTWQPIIYVSYGLLNNFMEYDSMDYIRNNQGMTEIVRNIAVINVKKLPGFTRTYDYGTIWTAYNKHKSTLLKQLETYNPNIIIGGSTMQLFYEDLGIKKEEIKKYGCVDYAILNSKLFISAYHPAQTQVTRNAYVDDIIQLAKTFEILWN
jgi:hypothetical protein